MATSSQRRTSSSNSTRKNTTKKTSGKSSSTRTSTRKPTAAEYRKESEMLDEIGLIIFFVLMVILFLCNFGIIGVVGNAISGVLFGLFGLTAYVVPVVLFIAVTFWYANTGNPHAVRKLISGIVLFLMIGIVCDLIAHNASNMTEYDFKAIYNNCKTGKNGGGIFAGSLTYILYKYLEFVGTILVVVLCAAVSFILMTERSLISGVKDGGSRMLEKGREDSQRRKEYAQQRRLIQEENRVKKEEDRARKEVERRMREEERENERRVQAEEKENEKILRMDKKVTGVAMDTTIPKKDAIRRRDDIHEITYMEEKKAENAEEPVHDSSHASDFDFDKIRIRSAHQLNIQEVQEENLSMEAEEPAIIKEPVSPVQNPSTGQIRVHTEHTEGIERKRPVAKPAPAPAPGVSASDMQISKDIEAAEKKVPKKYIFPPLSRLQKGSGSQDLDQTSQARLGN